MPENYRYYAFKFWNGFQQCRDYTRRIKQKISSYSDFTSFDIFRHSSGHYSCSEVILPSNIKETLLQWKQYDSLLTLPCTERSESKVSFTGGAGGDQVSCSITPLVGQTHADLSRLKHSIQVHYTTLLHAILYTPKAGNRM